MSGTNDVETNALDGFINMILNEENVSPYAIFSNNEYGDEEDLLSSFFSFLVSKCIIRYTHRYGNSSGVYVFSTPGRTIMKNHAKRITFIEEFMRFYKPS